MKSKNRPKRMKQKRKSKKPTRQKRFNPWVYKYFDMTGEKNELRKDPERKAHK